MYQYTKYVYRSDHLNRIIVRGYCEAKGGNGVEFTENLDLPVSDRPTLPLGDD